MTNINQTFEAVIQAAMWLLWATSTVRVPKNTAVKMPKGEEYSPLTLF